MVKPTAEHGKTNPMKEVSIGGFEAIGKDIEYWANDICHEECNTACNDGDQDGW